MGGVAVMLNIRTTHPCVMHMILQDGRALAYPAYSSRLSLIKLLMCQDLTADVSSSHEGTAV